MWLTSNPTEESETCDLWFELSFVCSIYLIQWTSFLLTCFISGEGLSASRHSLRTGLSASNLSLRGESPLSLLLSHLLPSSRVGTPAGSRCTTPVPTPHSSPPSSPGLSRLASRSSQLSQHQAPELLVSPSRDDIPRVVIHPPEEDIEALKGQEQKNEENVDFTPGNCPESSTCGALPLAHLHWECLSHVAWAAYVDSACDWTAAWFAFYSVLQNRIKLLKLRL